MGDNYYKQVFGESPTEQLKTRLKEIEEKDKRAAELIIANKELAFQTEEKADRAAELIIANKELAFQNEEKDKRAAELIIANKELAFQNEEKAERAAELIIANKELAFQNEEKAERAAELIIANKELAFQNEEKDKRAAELIIANKELAFQNGEKDKRAAELMIANKELAFQNEEKDKRRAELIIANKEAEAAEAASAAKSQFLSNMSHEIRTPINGIMGFLELLNMSNLSAEQKEFIREAKTASNVLLYVINDILDFSKIEAGKLTMENTSFRIRTATEDAVSLLVPKAAEKNIELHTMIKANVPEEVIGDPARLRQILNNLVGNAVKFTESGNVSVTVDCIEEEREIALLKFEIKDTGIGIRQDVIHKLFQSFNQADASTTRKYGGTGLGLAISKELVKMMGGTIHVESTVGEGSTFSFDVRFKISKRNSEQKIVFEKLSGVNVLIVDNNNNHRKIIGAYLKGVGCKVFEAKDAGNGITTILSNEGTNNKINIAILDYQMPGMSAYELATTLKTIPFAKDIKLILLTSAAQKGDAIAAKEMGFVSYLSKPVRRDELLNCIAIVRGLKIQEEQVPIIARYTLNEVKDALRPRILLVEDNEMNRKIFIKMLKSQDLTCDVAMDGHEALQALVKKEYDIVFMDCQMPVMDGYESTKEIRKLEGNSRHTTIVAMTANAMEGDRAKCIEAGMDDYISKPVNFEVMFQMIAKNTKQSEYNSEHFGCIYNNIDTFMNDTGLDKEDAQELFTQYIKYLSKQLAYIKEAIEQEDFEKIGNLAHDLKGSAGNLRITSIYELAMKLGEATIKQEKDECERTFAELQKLFH